MFVEEIVFKRVSSDRFLFLLFGQQHTLTLFLMTTRRALGFNSFVKEHFFTVKLAENIAHFSITSSVTIMQMIPHATVNDEVTTNPAIHKDFAHF